MTFNGENHIVVWCDEKYSGTALITAGRVTPQGTVIDTGNFVGEPGVHVEYNPHIEFDGSRCLVVWYNHDVGDSICGRFINSSALPEDSILIISQVYTYFPLPPAPRIAFDNTNYLIVWHDKLPDSTDYDIFGQFVSTSGTLINDTIMIVSDTFSQLNPCVSYDGASYLVVWTESDGVYGQRVATNGQLIDTKFLVSDTTSFTRRTPWVSASSSNFLVVWAENRTDYDIYGNTSVVIGCEEERMVGYDAQYTLWTTIFTGPLILPENRNCRVFDITGRLVTPQHIKPGIYFIETDGQITQKVIKVR